MISGKPKLLKRQNLLRDIVKSLAGQGANHVQSAPAFLQKAVGSLQVAHHVPLRHVGAAFGAGGGLHLGLAYRRQFQLPEDGLHGLGGSAAYL